jgi:hypothetical protein
MAVDWPVRRHDWVAILVAIRSKTVGRISTDPLSSEEIQGAAKWQIYNALCILLYLNVHLNLIHGVIFPTMNPLLAEIAINPAMSGKSNSRQSDGSIYGCN